MQIEGSCTNQAFLFGVIDRACRVSETARASVADLKEHKGLAILAHEVYFAAAIVNIALKNPDASTGKVSGCDAFEMIAQGFGAIHGS